MDLARAAAVAASVPDPELPFMTVSDLGILRDVFIENDIVVAQVSPTYSGCPAVVVIEQSILAALTEAGFNSRVQRMMSPAWTTDWITTEGRKKLRANGIAAPAAGRGTDNNPASEPILFSRITVSCPQCDSDNTHKVSEFGSTPCKAQYRCDSCGEPFDYFKCL
ncbi:phenylacetate-CoA oxygenase subunit PaaJ [Chromatiales bacterium (ex Bugula neritina AB1)]|nr:phenylacetate-CoA oxygenase subunit PaaJ [Chromatiales bacterium (ex Bugula neritina AB1)]